MINNLYHTHKRTVRGILVLALISTAALIHGQEGDEGDDAQVFELSPFEVDASEDMGYYASQSLAGGRLSTDIINTGTSIEVVTMDFMDDLGATDIQELLQYTTSTEIGGELGNFVGFDLNPGLGELTTQDAQRNPDANARIRGLEKPDKSRNFFKTDIPFDSYNTERLDINRGTNSFLFGLGSPAGLINNNLSRARFRENSKLRFRVGSGGERPSFRAEIDLNRVIIKDRLAVRVAGMLNRTQYRQRPNYRDDNRIYGTVTWHPFDNNKMTTIRAHWESGDNIGSSVSSVLPQQALDSWIKYRTPYNTDLNVRYWKHHDGPSEGDLTGNGGTRFDKNDVAAIHEAGGHWPVFDLDEDGNVINYEGRPGTSTFQNIGSNGHLLFFDGRNGRDPSMVFMANLPNLNSMIERSNKITNGGWVKDSETGLRYWAPKIDKKTGLPMTGHPWWDPAGRRSNGKPAMKAYLNSRREPDRGLGWNNQGFTDLETFDFTKQSLAGDSDYVTQDFYNYNFALEQLLLDGKAGFEVAFDFQNHVRSAFTSLTGGPAEIAIDINQIILVPQWDSNGDLIYPEYYTEENAPTVNHINAPVVDENGNVVGSFQENPNFGRPYIISKTGRDYFRNDRTAYRFTGFYKLDFEDYSGDDGLLKWLGSHTLSFLADGSVEEYEKMPQTLTTFSDTNDYWGVASSDASNASRTNGLVVYMGPPIQSYIPNAFDRNTPISMSDIILTPANYNLEIPDGYRSEMTYWKLVDDPDDPFADTWDTASFEPRWLAESNSTLRRTEVKSWAINAQSFFLNRHLVINSGYREDYIEEYLNRTPPRLGEEQIPTVTPDVFSVYDGSFMDINKGPQDSGTFGWGAVLHWPTDLIKLPANTQVAFHYNTSDNFVPDNSRVSINADKELYAISSPSGSSKDYGVTFQMFDRKFIVRLNWYENVLHRRDSNLENLLDQMLRRMYAFYGNLNTEYVELQTTEAEREAMIAGEIDWRTFAYSGQITQEDIDLARDIEYDEDGETIIWQETDQEVLARQWPYWDEAKQAREELGALLNSGYWQLYEQNQRISWNPENPGDFNASAIEGLVDVEDVKATGFEASFTWNPTRNLRMRVNVARQQTVKSNIVPNLSRYVDNEYLPYVQKWGDLKLNNPSQDPGNTSTVGENWNDRLMRYFTIKAQEGFPSDEVREWRVNLVSNYSFRDGILDGFRLGFSARYQSDSAIGYPLIEYSPEALNGDSITIGDVNNAYMSDEVYSWDVSFAYGRKFGKVNWDIQLNLRNLQNYNCDELSVIATQPDGSAARVRWDPPFQFQLTNTFRW